MKKNSGNTSLALRAGTDIVFGAEAGVLATAPKKGTLSERRSSVLGISQSKRLEMLEAAFDAQLETLIRLGYHEAAGISADEFSDKIDPLRRFLPAIVPSEINRIPFVIAIPHTFVQTEDQAVRLAVSGKVCSGHKRSPDLDVSTPNVEVYLLVDVDYGADLAEVRDRREALNELRKERRSVLTLCEGIALFTHFPRLFILAKESVLLGSGKFDEEEEDWENPVIYMKKNGRPTIKNRLKDEFDEELNGKCKPSCRFRFA